MASRERIGFILLLLLTAALFLVNLGGYDLWPPDEPRFAEIAREMKLSGDPIVLHVNNEFYKEKPPLLFWSIVAASLPAGEITSLTARMPSALAAFVTVLLTVLLARRLFDERTALWAGLILATTGLFWWEARSVRTDMLFTACTTASLYAFWRFHESQRFGWLAALYFALAAALFTKGPPALVFLVLTAIVFYWKQPQPRKRLHLILGILIAAIPVLAWFLVASRLGASAAPSAEEAAAGANLFRQTIGRFFMGVSKAQPPWYFVEVLPLDLLPWTLFLPWTLLYAWRRRRDGEAMRFLLSWIVPAFIFFSISIGKRAVYLLPIYPAIAILFSRSILDLMESDRLRWRRITAAVAGVLLLLLAAAPYGLHFTEYRESWNNGFFILMAVAFLGGLDMLRRAIFTEARTLHKAVALSFSALVLLAALIALPAVNAHKSARGLTEPLRILSRTGAEYRLYSVGFSREEYVFYAEHFHTPILTELLELELPVKLDLETMVKAQRRAKKDLTEAVAEVPVADPTRITDAEAAALRAAADKSVAESKVDPAFAQAFESALTKTVDTFVAEFETGGPAFFFVEDVDWRWLVALYPHLRDFPVVDYQAVGSRGVLLIANTPASAMTEAD
ncbi:MAG: glycosyltransferase family 39 protein [FCB group bacterium]|jgi:4-amino-4-deoxy-L-arabinose transferase-like glycosyltransferase|nr:glycosyltransferase family 39 protein [FCB group bacterium]